VYAHLPLGAVVGRDGVVRAADDEVAPVARLAVCLAAVVAVIFFRSSASLASASRPDFKPCCSRVYCALVKWRSAEVITRTAIQNSAGEVCLTYTVQRSLSDYLL